MEVNISARPESIKIDIHRSALIVVDMQNAFCSKKGLFDVLASLDEAKTKRVVEIDRAVIEASRRKGIKVIYLRMAYRPDLSNAGGTGSPNYYKEAGMVAMRQHAFVSRYLVAGTWDWEIIDDLRPLPGDIVVDKNRYSGFFNTELNSILQTLGIRYLLFAGIATNVCVESTLRDAYFFEYFPILITDGCGNAGPDYTQEATIWNVSTVFGWVTTGAEVVQALQ